MKNEKKFDCVDMKNDIQSTLSKQWQGMKDADIEVQIREDLEKSQSSSAKLWRRIEKRIPGRSCLTVQ